MMMIIVMIMVMMSFMMMIMVMNDMIMMMKIMIMMIMTMVMMKSIMMIMILIMMLRMLLLMMTIIMMMIMMMMMMMMMIIMMILLFLNYIPYYAIIIIARSQLCKGLYRMSVLAVNCRAMINKNKYHHHHHNQAVLYTTPHMTFTQRYMVFSVITNPPSLNYNDFIAANERILQTDHIAEMIGVTTAANICFQNAKKLFDELRKCMGNKASPGQSTANNPPTEFGFIVHGTEKLFLDSIMVATKV